MAFPILQIKVPLRREGMLYAMADHSPRRVTEVLDRLDEAAGKADDVTIEDMVHALGERSYGPFLLIPALLDISPLGSIPGVPTALALILLLFAAQVAIGRKHLWLPGFIETRRVGSKRLRKSVRALRGIELGRTVGSTVGSNGFSENRSCEDAGMPASAWHF